MSVVVAPILAAAVLMPLQARPAGVQSFGSPTRATSSTDLTICEVGAGVAVSSEIVVVAVDEPAGVAVGAGVLEKRPQPAKRTAATAAPTVRLSNWDFERFIVAEL